MILVTVGTHTDPFLRLIEGMDRVAAGLDEEVIMQTGVAAYHPKAATAFAFTSQEHMEELCREARIIVSHAGSGCILTALRRGKPLVVMPRLGRYGEHINDHQIELAHALSEMGALLVANDADELQERVAQAGGFAPVIPCGSRLIEALRRETLLPEDA
jgi:UDP-N-acetylglucosamine transferase subunit ALG13